MEGVTRTDGGLRTGRVNTCILGVCVMAGEYRERNWYLNSLGPGKCTIAVSESVNVC